jgi:hypothetical protein
MGPTVGVNKVEKDNSGSYQNKFHSPPRTKHRTMAMNGDIMTQYRVRFETVSYATLNRMHFLHSIVSELIFFLTHNFLKGEKEKNNTKGKADMQLKYVKRSIANK